MHQIVDTVQGICTKTVCKKISIEFLDVAGLDVDKRLVRKRCGPYVFIPQVQIVFSGAGLNLGSCGNISSKHIIERDFRGFLRADAVIFVMFNSSFQLTQFSQIRGIEPFSFAADRVRVAVAAIRSIGFPLP